MILIGNKTPKSITIGGKDVASIALNNEIVWNKQALIESPLRIDKRSDVGTRTVSLTKNGNAPEINLEYSFNNSTWQTWTPDSSGNRTMSLPANTSMFIRGNNPNGLATIDNDFYSFSCDKNYGIAGDIRSLVSHYEVDTLPDFCFRGLFKNSTTLSAADYSRIESTNLSRYCYSQMFYGCTNLLRAPHNLPASIVSERAYGDMFYGCTSLEVMPIIAATTFGNNACINMFKNCTSLTQQWASDTPSVKTKEKITFNIASDNGQTHSFYGMFNGCSSLVDASGITATKTTDWKDSVCRNMFRDCSALTSAPSITFGSFASGLSHCQGMFHGCTSLVSTPNIHLDAPTLYALTCKNMYYGCTSLTIAPEIKATTLTDSGTNHENGSLAIMFYNCSSLTYIKVNFTDWNNGYYTNQWTYGLPSSGRFDCPSGLAQTKNASGNTTNPHYIPYNWSINEEPPPKLITASVVKTSGRREGINYYYEYYATLKFSTGSGSSAVSGVTYYVNWSTSSSVTNPTTTNYHYKLEGTGTNSEVSKEFNGGSSSRIYIKVLSVKSGYTNSDIKSANFLTG